MAGTTGDLALLGLAGLGAYLFLRREPGPPAPATNAVSSPTTGAGVHSTGTSAPTDPSTSADGYRSGLSAGGELTRAAAEWSAYFKQRVSATRILATPGVTHWTFKSVTGQTIRALFAGYDSSRRSATYVVQPVIVQSVQRGGPPERLGNASMVSIPWDARPYDPSPAGSPWTMLDFWASKQGALKWGTPTESAQSAGTAATRELFGGEPVIDLWGALRRLF